MKVGNLLPQYHIVPVCYDGPVFNDITQIAFVVPDARALARVFEERLHLGAFKFWDFEAPVLFDTTYRGESEPWTMRLGVGWVGNTQIEIIEPTGGKSVYQDFLDMFRAGGIHHVLLGRTGSYKEAKAHLVGQGVPTVQSAAVNAALKLGPLTIPPAPQFLANKIATRFSYTESTPLGLSLEVSQFPPLLSPRMGLRLGKPNFWTSPKHTTFEHLPEGAFMERIEGITVLAEENIRSRYEDVFGKHLVDETFAFPHLNLRVSVPTDGFLKEVFNERGVGTHILTVVLPFRKRVEAESAYLNAGFGVAHADDNSLFFVSPDVPVIIEGILSE